MMQRKPYTVRPMQTPAPHTFHTFHGLPAVAGVAWTHAGAGPAPAAGCTLAWGTLTGHSPDPASAGHPALLPLIAAAVPEEARGGSCLVAARSDGPGGPVWWAFVLANGDLAPETVQSFAAPDDLADHVRAETTGGGIDCIAASPDADPALAGAGLPVHILDPGLIDRDGLPVFTPVAVRDPGLPRRMALAGAGAVALLALGIGGWQAVAWYSAPPPPPPEIARVRDLRAFATGCAQALARADWPHAPGWEVEVRGCHDGHAAPDPDLDRLGLGTAAFTVYRRDPGWSTGLALAMLDIVMADLTEVRTRLDGTDRLVAAYGVTAPMVPDNIPALLHRTFADMDPKTAQGGGAGDKRTGAGGTLGNGGPGEQQSGPDGRTRLRITATPGEVLERLAPLAGIGLLSLRTGEGHTVEAVVGPPVAKLQAGGGS